MAESGCVEGGILAVRVNQNVRIDSNHPPRPS
jgi:hypothetical protein